MSNATVVKTPIKDLDLLTDDLYSTNFDIYSRYEKRADSQTSYFCEKLLTPFHFQVTRSTNIKVDGYPRIEKIVQAIHDYYCSMIDNSRSLERNNLLSYYSLEHIRVLITCLYKAFREDEWHKLNSALGEMTDITMKPYIHSDRKGISHIISYKTAEMIYAAAKTGNHHSEMWLKQSPGTIQKNFTLEDIFHFIEAKYGNAFFTTKYQSDNPSESFARVGFLSAVKITKFGFKRPISVIEKKCDAFLSELALMDVNEKLLKEIRQKIETLVQKFARLQSKKKLQRMFNIKNEKIIFELIRNRFTNEFSQSVIPTGDYIEASAYVYLWRVLQVDDFSIVGVGEWREKNQNIVMDYINSLCTEAQAKEIETRGKKLLEDYDANLIEGKVANKEKDWSVGI